MRAAGRWRMAHILSTLAFSLLLMPGCTRSDPANASIRGGEKPMTEIAKETEIAKQDVFPAQVAGRFYEADPGRLRKEIETYLSRASVPRTEGDLLGFVVPHAGYPYSGPVAAFAFAELRGRAYKRVVVLGPAHQRGFAEPALLDADAYATPLGEIPIDRAGVSALAQSGAAKVDREKFQSEHALEVELPFLQVALGAPFELVPVMIGRPDLSGLAKLGKALKQAFPDNTLFVASTDMSHDYPYDVAVAMDENGVKLIQALDSEGLVQADQAFRQAGRSIRVGSLGRPEPACTQLCGLGTVLTLVELAKLYPGARAKLLDRRTSGDIIGDRSSRIVGYAAIAFSLPAGQRAAAEGRGGVDFLGQAEQRELLRIARQTLERHIRNGETPEFTPESKRLLEPGAAFVTLKKQGDLRGCIGHMEPTDPLWKMIRDRAIDAAVHDTRFRPVQASELGEIAIEISVLTPRVEVRDPLREIQIGRDGVWLELGMNRGVFLPQVPVEQGWKTVEEYLDNLCRKAHVPKRGCWREARLQRFSAQVFGE